MATSTRLPLRLVYVSADRYEVLPVRSRRPKHQISYTVISHVWGQDTVAFSQANHCIPGVRWAIQLDKNDLSKIERIVTMARARQITWLWIDILCIDQSNRSEKATEILQLRQYYQHAEQCIAVLTPEANLDFAKLERLAKATIPFWPNIPIDTNNPFADVPIDMRNTAEQDNCRKIVQILTSIGSCPWFYRVWTLEEATLPAIVWLWDGRVHGFMELEELYSWWRISGSTLGYSMDWSRPRLQTANTLNIRAEGVTRFKNAFHGVNFPKAVIRSGKFDTAQAMSISATKYTTNSVDHVVGILAMVSYPVTIRNVRDCPNLLVALLELAKVAISNRDLSLAFHSGYRKDRLLLGCIPKSIFSPTQFSIMGGCRLFEAGHVSPAGDVTIRGVMIRPRFVSQQLDVNASRPIFRTMGNAGYYHDAPDTFIASIIRCLVSRGVETSSGISQALGIDCREGLVELCLRGFFVLMSGTGEWSSWQDLFTEAKRQNPFPGVFDPILEAVRVLNHASARVASLLAIDPDRTLPGILEMINIRTSGEACAPDFAIFAETERTASCARKVRLFFPCESVDDNTTHGYHSDSDDDSYTLGTTTFEHHAFTRCLLVVPQDRDCSDTVSASHSCARFEVLGIAVVLRSMEELISAKRTSICLDR